MYNKQPNTVDIPAAVSTLLEQQNPSLTPAIPLWNMIEKIIPRFKELCEKCSADQDMAEAWCPDRAKDEPDLGLIYKDGGAFDHKYFLHYVQGIDSLIPDSHIGPHEETLLLNAQKIWQYLDVLSGALYRELDVQTQQKFGKNFLLEDRYRDLPDLKRLKLRFLYYLPKAENFAKPHYDRDGLTFHLWESKPALQYGANKTLYEAQEDQVLLMPGMKTAIITDPQYQELGIDAVEQPGWQPAGVLQPTPHKALRDPADTEERFSVVAFSHVDMPDVVDEEFFSRIQKRNIKEMAY